MNACARRVLFVCAAGLALIGAAAVDSRAEPIASPVSATCPEPLSAENIERVLAAVAATPATDVITSGTGRGWVQVLLEPGRGVHRVQVAGQRWVTGWLVVDEQVGADPGAGEVEGIRLALERWQACAAAGERGGALVLMTERGLHWLTAAGDPFETARGPAAWLRDPSIAPPQALFVIDVRALPDGRVGAVVVEDAAAARDPSFVHHTSLWFFAPADDGTWLVDGILGNLVAAYPAPNRSAPLPTAVAVR